MRFKNHFFTIAILLFFGFLYLPSSSAQMTSDEMWFVKENAAVYNAHQLSSGTFLMDNVLHPLTTIPQARNDLFFIYTNTQGKQTYFNSKEITDWEDLNGQSPSEGYQLINAGSTINYLYFTNVYEDDEEPERVASNNGIPITLDMEKSIAQSLNQSPTQSTGPKLKELGVSNDVLTANHTIKSGRDFTLIIRDLTSIIERVNSKEEPTYSACTFDLCWQMQDQSLSLANFQIVESNVFDNDFKLNLRSSIVQDTCITGIQLQNSLSPHAFINLRAPDYLPNELVDKTIIFTLSPQAGEDCFGGNLPLVVGKAHDPNYVKVLSIHETPTYDYAKYHVEWMNDVTDQTTESFVEFSLPNSQFSDIEITEASINGEQLDLSIPTPVHLGNNRMRISFLGDPDLGMYVPWNSERSTAYVEFNMRFNKVQGQASISDRANYNLSLPHAYTVFGQDIFPIQHYYDVCEFFNHEYDDDGFVYLERKYQTCTERPVLNNSPMSNEHCPQINTCCDQKGLTAFLWFTSIMLGIILLLLIVLIFRRTRLPM